MKQIPSDVMIAIDMAAAGETVGCMTYGGIGSVSSETVFDAHYFDVVKFTPKYSHECKWPGLEVTELADGGYYFAPPGDFSKVDFSACQVRPEDGVTLTFSGPKGSPDAFWTCRVVEDGILKITGYSEDPNKALEAARVGHLKMPSYGPVNEWPIEAASPARHMVSGGPATGLQSFARMGGECVFLEQSTPLSGKPVTAPKTAQHSEQAKPALPSLMTEAGEKYQGLGWCDE